MRVYLTLCGACVFLCVFTSHCVVFVFVCVFTSHCVVRACLYACLPHIVWCMHVCMCVYLTLCGACVFVCVFTSYCVVHAYLYACLPHTVWCVRAYVRVYLTLYSALADLGGGVRDARPPWASKFFRFHAVFGKIWRVHAPPGGFTPPLGKILDPPL